MTEEEAMRPTPEHIREAYNQFVESELADVFTPPPSPGPEVEPEVLLLPKLIEERGGGWTKSEDREKGTSSHRQVHGTEKYGNRIVTRHSLRTGPRSRHHMETRSRLRKTRRENHKAKEN